MRSLEFVLTLLLLAALGGVGWAYLRERDRNVQLAAALTASAVAHVSETANSTRAQTACVREATTGVRVGRAIAELSAPVVATPGEPRPMLTASDLADVAAP